MITIDRIDSHTADITIGTLAIPGVPIDTWHEGACAGARSYTAVSVDWRSIFTSAGTKVEGCTLTSEQIDALDEADPDLAEPLQLAYEQHQLDDRG